MAAGSRGSEHHFDIHSLPQGPICDTAAPNHNEPHITAGCRGCTARCGGAQEPQHWDQHGKQCLISFCTMGELLLQEKSKGHCCFNNHLLGGSGRDSNATSNPWLPRAWALDWVLMRTLPWASAALCPQEVVLWATCCKAGLYVQTDT